MAETEQLVKMDEDRLTDSLAVGLNADVVATMTQFDNKLKICASQLQSWKAR